MPENQGNYLLRNIPQQDKMQGGSNKKVYEIGVNYHATRRLAAGQSKLIVHINRYIEGLLKTDNYGCL